MVLTRSNREEVVPFGWVNWPLVLTLLQGLEEIPSQDRHKYGSRPGGRKLSRDELVSSHQSEGNGNGNGKVQT